MTYAQPGQLTMRFYLIDTHGFVRRMIYLPKHPQVTTIAVMPETWRFTVSADIRLVTQ